MIRSQINRFAKFWMTLGAIVIFMGSAKVSFGQVTNTNVYAPANYTAFQPPAKGGSYTDAVFGAPVKRLTDSMKVTRADMGSGSVTTIAPEYSTMSPFNMDNSRLILEHFSYFGLYDGAGNYLKDLPFDTNASSEPRWSRTDPNVLYYIHGNQLKQLNVGSNAITVVKTFSEYSAISGAGESDISADGNHFVLAGDRSEVFTFDISTGTKSPVFSTAGHGFDSLYISSKNNVTITWNSAGAGRYQGIEMFDQNMNFQRQLTKAGGHMDIATDVNGDDVLLWTNSADPTPIASCQNGIVKVRLSDAKQTCLVQLDWSLAVHVSAPDNNGWVFVETYSPSDIVPPTGWKTYTDEFLQVKLDGTEVRRIAHHRSRPLNSYTYMPKVSTSRDGSKLVFGSNFGLQAQQGLPKEYSDAYMIDLGPTAVTAPAPAPAPQPTPAPAPAVTPAPAPAPTATTTEATTRVQQDAAGIAYAGNWSNNSMTVHSGGSAKLAMDLGSRVMFSFTGTAATWIGYSDEWSGIAKVTVDGISKGEVDTYKKPGKAQSVQYTVSGLTQGDHTLTIEATGRRNTASGGAWIWIDAFDYTSGGTAAASSAVTTTAAPATTVTATAPATTTTTAPVTSAAPAPATAPATTTTTAPVTSAAPAPATAPATTTTAAPVTSPAPAAPVAAAPTAAPVTSAAPVAAATPTGARYHVEETAAAVRFEGSWNVKVGSALSGCTAKFAMGAGSSVSFTFTGDAITWIAYRDQSTGIAKVMIDGLFEGNIDTYSATATPRAKAFTVSGLSWGTHTITIEVTGSHNFAATGSAIWVDAFDYNGLPLQ